MIASDAAASFKRALELLDAIDKADDHRRITLLQALGEARRQSGDVAAGRHTLQEAALLARRVGDAHLFARVVLTFGWSFDRRKFLAWEHVLGRLPDGLAPKRADTSEVGMSPRGGGRPRRLRGGSERPRADRADRRAFARCQPVQADRQSRYRKP